MPQLPAIIGEAANDEPQRIRVRVQTAVGAVDDHVRRDKLAKVLERVPVAARVIAAVKGRELVLCHVREDPLRSEKHAWILGRPYPGPMGLCWCSSSKAIARRPATEA